MRNFAATAIALVGLASQQVEALHPQKPPKIMEHVPTVKTLQMSGELTHEICTRSVDRMMHENVNPNELFRKQMDDPNFQWTDTTFQGDYALQWPDMPVHDSNSLSYWLDDSSKEMKRLSEIFDDSYSLFGRDEITFHDAKQSGLGDCWIHAAASVVALDPQRIRNLFVTEKLNKAGVYSLNMYMLGIPTTVTVDEFLPAKFGWFQDAEGEWEDEERWGLTFSVPSPDGSLWMPILEKAAAKLYGNYEMLQGGLMGPAVQSLTGAPYYRIQNGDDYQTGNDLWDKLKEKFDKGWMITAASHFGAGGDQSRNDIELPYSHAYSILGMYELSDGTKLYKVRNPWGKETYSGPYSDDDWRWTTADRELVGAVEANDGVWFMDAQTYNDNLQFTDVNPDVQDEKMTYYAAFEVTAETEQSEMFYITSEVDQMVYISGYTYNDQHIDNGGCNANSPGVSLWLIHEDGQGWIQFSGGQAHADGYQMYAGQRMWIKLDVTLPSTSMLAHDFSLVILAEEEAVKLETSGQNYDMSVFPHYKISDNVVIHSLFDEDTPTPTPTPDEDGDDTPTPSPTPIPTPDEDGDDTPTPDADGVFRNSATGDSFHQKFQVQDGPEVESWIRMLKTTSMSDTLFMGHIEIQNEGNSYTCDWTFDYNFYDEDGRVSIVSYDTPSSSLVYETDWSSADFSGNWNTLVSETDNGQYTMFQVKSAFNGNSTDYGYWEEGSELLIHFYISDQNMYYASFFDFDTGKVVNEFYSDTNTLLGLGYWDTKKTHNSAYLLAQQDTVEEESAKTVKQAKHDSADYTMGGIVAASAISVAVAAFCVNKKRQDAAVSDDFARI